MTLTNAQTKLLMDEISKLDSNLSNRTVRLWDSFQYAIDSGKSLPEYLCENFNFSHISQFRVMYSATYKAAGVNNRQDFLKILEINKDDSGISRFSIIFFLAFNLILRRVLN